MPDIYENYIITNIKESYSSYSSKILKYTYTAIPIPISASKENNQKAIRFSSNAKLDLYAKIKQKEIIEQQDSQILSDENIIKGSREEYEKYIQKFITPLSNIINNIKCEEIKIVNEEVSKPICNMFRDLKEVALIIIKNILTGAPIVVRFHNDADGSSGALALYKAVDEILKKNFINLDNDSSSIIWRLNKSIKYGAEEFYEDSILFERYTSAEKPLILVIDFGTTEESSNAITLASNYNLIFIDHHPVYEGFPRSKLLKYINPWDYKGDSNHTAGFVTGVLAQIITGKDNDTDIINSLMEASLIGDHSIYADMSNKEAEKISVFLDYTTGKNKVFSINETINIIEDKSKLDEKFKHSTRIFEEALNSSIKYIHRYKGGSGINIFVLDFNDVERIEEDFPLPGRFSTKLHDNLEAINGPNITMVHYGNYISLRISDSISESINIIDIFEKLKSKNKHVYSFGGHKAAASIKINKNYIKNVLKDLLMLLGVQTIKNGL
ncbi:MAG: DHH family phosphoesterase [Candidatus Micrarchaeia archaeon]